MYNATEFSDYYEILCVDQRADQGVIDSIYRHLVKRYHPDHAETADISRFKEIVEAYTTLKDPAKRSQYDEIWQRKRSGNFDGGPEKRASNGVGMDVDLQEKVLLALYAKRRSHPRDAGIGEIHLLNSLGCEEASLEFVIWYLKEKGFIKKDENGTFSITTAGVDHIIQQYTRSVELLQISDATNRAKT